MLGLTVFNIYYRQTSTVSAGETCIYEEFILDHFRSFPVAPDRLPVCWWKCVCASLQLNRRLKCTCECKNYAFVRVCVFVSSGDGGDHGEASWKKALFHPNGAL